MDNNTVSGSRINPAAGDDDEGTWLHAWGLITSFAVSMTLKAAIELGIFDALSNTGSLAITADELAARLPTMDKAGGSAPVDRIMRLLASFDVVKCVTEAGPSGEAIRQYKPLPVCRWLSSNHGGPSLAPYAMFTTDQDFLMAWQQLGAAVGGGQTAFKRTHGVPMGEHLGRNPRVLGVVDKAMVQISVMVTSKLLERFHGFDDVAVLVDVGGGTGSTLEMITSRYKHIRGINFDLPHVISLSPSILGVEHIAGNMFDNVPTGDVIFLKTVLHMFDDNDCIKILKNCRQALSDKGRLIAVEFVLPATPELTRAAQNLYILDVMMLNNSEGGKERTAQEFLKLVRESGFSGTFQSTYIFGNFWALEFTK
ncbi:Eugenol O-methyltransferase [Triticum urartu]|uniref:Eugenol O-methyltransferase n=2 Tax=Triticum urartu TaxID=4572 RepID=M7Z2T0_TRIUA|nr:probable inactive methyltransferase Os04g0175900 [Triticum dicoccoides]XP_048551472.1 probable inactive methyltransferase Os04g0175900 [Triticum urartu]EMS46655.1 Eugenol O-methyltransferase [Triticum urartu]